MSGAVGEDISLIDAMIKRGLAPILPLEWITAECLLALLKIKTL